MAGEKRNILASSSMLGRKFGGAVACENIRFSSLFAVGDLSGVLRNVPAAKNEEKRMFSQASGAGEVRPCYLCLAQPFTEI